MNIRDELFELSEEDYKRFNSSLLPNIDKNRFIGCRIPSIRKLSKSISNEDAMVFINNIPHYYFEENFIHSCFLSRFKNFNEYINYLDIFLEYVDNWEICDTIDSKIFKKNIDDGYYFLCKQLKSNHIYRKRFSIVCFFKYYLDSKYFDKICKLIMNIKTDEYYINMARSWFFQESIIFQYDKTIKILECKKLDKFTHNKTISKCVDSYRISKEVKEYLKTLRIK